MFYKKFFFLIIITIFSINSVVLAISAHGGKKDYFLEYTLEPEVPQPNQLVKLVLRSYHFNMTTSQVFIYENNKLVKNGTGLRNYYFYAPDGGKRKVITVVVKDLDGKIYRQDITINPMEVTLVYEVDGAYKPFFYKGKAYALSNSKIKFKAFADFFDEDGNYINPDNLVYDWYVNFKQDFDASGYGKKIFNIDRLDAYPIETVVQVKVFDKRRVAKASSALFLSPDDMEIDFYAVPTAEPFMFQNVYKNGVLSFKGLNGRIKAVPYFMNNINSLRHPVFLTWWVNGKRIFKKLDDDQTILDISTNSDSKIREGKIDIMIENKVRPFQYLEKSFKVKFIETENLENESDGLFNKSNKIRIEDKRSDSKGFFGLF